MKESARARMRASDEASKHQRIIDANVEVKVKGTIESTTKKWEPDGKGTVK